MKRKMVGLLIAFIIIVGFTHPIGPGNGGESTTRSEGGIGGL